MIASKVTAMLSEGSLLDRTCLEVDFPYVVHNAEMRLTITYKVCICKVGELVAGQCFINGATPSSFINSHGTNESSFKGRNPEDTKT